jgi:hypothetical protein
MKPDHAINPTARRAADMSGRSPVADYGKRCRIKNEHA